MQPTQPTHKQMRREAEKLVSNFTNLTTSEETVIDAAAAAANELGYTDENLMSFLEKVRKERRNQIEDQIASDLGENVVNAIRTYNTYLSIKLKQKIVLVNKDGKSSFELVPYSKEDLTEYWDGVSEDCY